MMVVMTGFTVVNMNSTAKKMILTQTATGRTGVAEENQKVGLLKATHIPLIFPCGLSYEHIWLRIKWPSYACLTNVGV